MKTIRVPGSKSETNRAIALAALGKSNLVLENYLECDDSRYMWEACRKMGVFVERDGNNLNIRGNGGTLTAPVKPVEVGNAGTTTRFLLALTCLVRDKVVIRGNEYMAKRPQKPLIDALIYLGADISAHIEADGCITFKVDGCNIQGGTVTLPGDISSQYITALLLLGSQLEEGITINLSSEILSKPYIDLTISIFKHVKLNIENRNYYQITIQGPQEVILPKRYVISGDASSASYWLLWAQLMKESITLNITHSCGQGDIRLVDILMEMGASYNEQDGILTYYPADLQQFSGDVSDVPDIVPTLAVICAGLHGVSRLQNVSQLRHKECDRLEALVENLNRLSIIAEVETINGREDLIVTGGVITPKDVIKTYDDHRMAMAFGTLQAMFPTLTVDNPACVQKSYPTFWDQLTVLNT